MNWGLNAGQPTAPAIQSNYYHPGYFTLLLRRIICCHGRSKSRKAGNINIYLDSRLDGVAGEFGVSLSDLHAAA